MSPKLVARARRVHGMLDPFNNGAEEQMDRDRSFLKGSVVVAIAMLLMTSGGPVRAAPTEKPSIKPVTTVVSDLAARMDGDATVIELKASSRPLFTVFKLARPPRLTIDIANGRFKGVSRLTEVDLGAVGQVAIAQFRTDNTRVARLMINLRRPSHYNVKVRGRRLIVTVAAHQPHKLARKSTRKSTGSLSEELAQVREELKQQREVARAAVEAATQLRKATVEARQKYERLSGTSRREARRELERMENKLKQAERARLAAEQEKQKLVEQVRRSKAAKTSRAIARARTHARARTRTRARTHVATLIRDIRFVDRKGAARVEIQLDSAGRLPHQEVSQEDGQPVLLLSGARLPKLLERTLDASEFNGPIKRISSYVSDRREGKVAVKVALRHSGAPNKVRFKGNKLIWEFAKSDASGGASKPGRQPKEPPTSYTYKSTQVAAARVRRRRRRAYSGRRIDLDFKDADIHNILRLLSEVGNVNIVTSDKVSGRVTIRMRNVPWDQALDVILRAKGLGQVREGNLVRVAPMPDLEKEREAELARQKQIVLLKPLETRLIPLSYAQAQQVLPKIQYMLSPRGKLTTDQRTNMVIARDIGANLDLMERLVRNLDTQTPQVLIESRIVEARTNFSREIGIQWGGSFTASQSGGNSTGLVFPNQIGIGGGASDGLEPTYGLLLGQDLNPNFAVNLPATVGTGAGGALGLTLGSVSGNVNINLRLSAAESTGDIRIVSAPKITTLDNVEASIEQGVTIPYSQVSAGGVQTTFKDAKLNLTVTPHVTADGSIIMKIKVENNEPDFVNTGPRGEPTILKKEAKTELLIKDGETTVIGGIYSTRTGRTISKVPWFGDIPILGFFFRTTRDTADRQEVLVFITPRIVNRAQSIGR